ncbi:MAG: N-acetylgalactosamine 6-sulfate sulfatase [Rhodothermaeota bacterium MED-G18]|nr:MAG: N-acetylgalactosamine 6-sulfate sulfatase [Rhodothermaeota bacterium MED-G18]|tara:strand:- start:740 stop:2149 length:1410 start_codon:yes stop_codon:yes gene_type:complete
MIRFLLLSVLSLLVISCKSSLENAPNIIIIISDDQGYADVGFHGSKEIFTPNIDRIASNGVVFSQGYVSYAVCSPSRAGLITGKYQNRFGYTRNILLAPKDSLMGLPLSEQTLPDVLNNVDYKTKAIGKWHLGAHESLVPERRGFDEFFGFLIGGHRYFPEDLTLNDLSEARRQMDGYITRIYDNGKRIDTKKYLTEELSDNAVKFIEDNSSDPFFLYLSYNAPHTPLQATAMDLERNNHIEVEKRRTYAAMVSSMDDGIGLILDKLEEKKITDNTIVIFFSDNGGVEWYNFSDNGILRGIKGDFYEGGIRVPFTMQWPSKIKPGTIYDKPIIALDVFATVASAASAEKYIRNDIDGVDILPYITGEKSGLPHKYLYWQNPDKDIDVVRDERYKYIRIEEEEYIFDLKNDISEEKNIINSSKPIYDRLKSQFKEWEKEMIDPVFMDLGMGREYNKLNPDRWYDTNQQIQ